MHDYLQGIFNINVVRGYLTEIWRVYDRRMPTTRRAPELVGITKLSGKFLVVISLIPILHYARL